MGFLADLWLPILLSSVFVFVVSSVIHMMVPWHKGDHAKLAGEAEVLAAIAADNDHGDARLRGHWIKDLW